MRYFLRGLAARLLHGNGTRKPNRRSRTLAFEQLGTRQLLAGDTATLTMESDEQAGLMDASSTPVATTESPLWAAPSGGASLISQNDGYGGYGQIDPEITSFSGTQQNPGGWIFTGQVVDDESVEGLTVTFGGLLEGHTTTVRADGTFDYEAIIPTGTSGFVTATVTDRDGLTSETVYFYVG